MLLKLNKDLFLSTQIESLRAGAPFGSFLPIVHSPTLCLSFAVIL
jgi:hypothetical protein